MIEIWQLRSYLTATQSFMTLNVYTEGIMILDMVEFLTRKLFNRTCLIQKYFRKMLMSLYRPGNFQRINLTVTVLYLPYKMQHTTPTNEFLSFIIHTKFVHLSRINLSFWQGIFLWNMWKLYHNVSRKKGKCVTALHTKYINTLHLSIVRCLWIWDP